MKISEIIKNKYKLRIPPTVYYDLLADVQEVEEKQEPMVEIDLYSVIKQKYIERDVLDKIRAEIENDWQLKKYPSSPFSCGLRRAIEIIDKYKAESEVKE